MKDRVLIVGAFKGKINNIYGGIAKSCELLLESPLSERFDILTIDSTQISNPGPNVFIRGLLAGKRLVQLIFFLIFKKPRAVILFISTGTSIFEKGTMGFLCKIFLVRSLAFPRAGEVILKAEKSKLWLYYLKFFFMGFDVFLCQGISWKRFAIEKLHFSEQQALIIPNWTATEEHLSIGKYRKYEVKNTPKIIFLGWLEEFKGIFELLNVSKALNDKGHQFHLTITGRGNAELQAKKFVQRSMLEKKVTFQGWVSGNQLNSLLKENNILVLPSWNEGMPNAVIEAMSAGLAIVTTRVGSIPDYLESMQNAILVDAKDESQLLNALELLFKDVNLISKLGLSAHKFATDNFSLEKGMLNLGDIVEKNI